MLVLGAVEFSVSRFQTPLLEEIGTPRDEIHCVEGNDNKIECRSVLECMVAKSCSVLNAPQDTNPFVRDVA